MGNVTWTENGVGLTDLDQGSSPAALEARGHCDALSVNANDDLAYAQAVVYCSKARRYVKEVTLTSYDTVDGLLCLLAFWKGGRGNGR